MIKFKILCFIFLMNLFIQSQPIVTVEYFLLIFLPVSFVAMVQGFHVASDGKLAVNGWILGGHIGLVEVVGMLHKARANSCGQLEKRNE